MTETTEPTDDEQLESEEAQSVQDNPKNLHGCPFTESHGQTVLHSQGDEYYALIETLKDEGYEVCVDLCGADYMGNDSRILPSTVSPERFELVVNLLDVEAARRVRIRVQISETSPHIASISDIHPGAEAMEREATDMFGLQFEGHPDPTPILLPDGWEGHPLRKDFSMGRIPVQFKAVDGR
tara:strand:- start:13473 stop:14018 length:546 start_codon:yes stop_codon:yes gene_type:complete